MLTTKKLFFFFSIIIASLVEGAATNLQSLLTVDYKQDSDSKEMQTYLETVDEKASSYDFENSKKFQSEYIGVLNHYHQKDTTNNAKNVFQSMFYVLFCKKLCILQNKNISLKDICLLAAKSRKLPKKNSADYLEKVFCALFKQFYDNIRILMMRGFYYNKCPSFEVIFGDDVKIFLQKRGFFYKNVSDEEISNIEETKKLTVDNYKDIVQKRYSLFANKFSKNWFDAIEQLIQEKEDASYFLPKAIMTFVVIAVSAYILKQKYKSKIGNAVK